MSKNVITYDTCHTELVRMTKADVYASTILFLVILLICVPLLLMAIYVAKYVLILGIVLSLVIAIWPLALLYKLISCIRKHYHAKFGDFSIVRDTVYSLSKGEVISKTSTADVIYFTNKGRFVPPKSTFDLSSIGDEFYIVVLHCGKQHTMLAYPMKIYEKR